MTTPKPPPKYPHAATYAQQYQDIITKLNAEVTAVSNAASCSDCQNPATYLDNSLTGDYYSEFEEKVLAWTEEIKRLKTHFATMHADLLDIIRRAETQKNLWNSRIGL